MTIAPANAVAYNPEGNRPEIVMRKRAARLTTLVGKTIYLIDGRFDNTGPLLVELAEWFNENHPETTIKFAKWKEPFTDDQLLCEQVQADGDAAILGVGLCSTCAPAIASHQVSLEADFGVPTVGIHTDSFSAIVDDVAVSHGMPFLPRCYVPHPIAGLTPDDLRALVRGTDVVTGQPLVELILSGLLDQPAEDELAVEVDRSTPRLVTASSPSALHDLFESEGWTDHFPIVLPTERLVDRMLAGTSRGRDEVVGTLAATHYREARSFTVEKVAVNAVMAGARPEYFPIILALASVGETARHSSSTSCATWSVVNGPIRNEIELNSGIGALGPYHHANATIARAFSLVSQNGQGGSVPGLTYMGSQGNPFQYGSPCIAENEERSPWESLSVQHGFGSEESTVTLFDVGWYTVWGTDVRADTWRDQFARSLRGMEPAAPPVLVIDPIAAREFVQRAGFDTKQKLIDWLYETATISAREYCDNREVRTWNLGKADQGLEPWASKFSAAPNEMVPMFDGPSSINVVVTGGETQGTWRFISGPRVKTVSVDDWR